MTASSTPTCLFCRTRPADSDEHIVLNALGGRKVVRGFSCEPGNNAFGSGIDKALEEAYRFASLVIGAHTGKNRPVAPLEMERSDTGERVAVQHGGKVRPRHEATVTLMDDTRTTPTKRPFKTFDPENVAQMIAAEMIRRDLVGQPATSTLTMHDTGPVPFELSGELGGPRQFRAVAKMGLAAQWGLGGAPSPIKLRKLCRWIVAGEGTWAHSLDAAAYPAMREALAIDDGMHVLAVWPIAGRLEATFLAFGFIPYRVRLPPQKDLVPVAHVVDPVNRTHEVVTIDSPPRLTSIETAFRSQESDNAAIQALFAWVDRAALDARLRGSVRDAFDRLKAQGHEFVELDLVPQLAADIAEGLVPRRGTRPLDPTPLNERIREIVLKRLGK